MNDFALDLTTDEIRRRHAMVAAMDDWSPAEALAGEDEALAMLYSGLDVDQQRVFDELVEAGVLARGES